MYLFDVYLGDTVLNVITKKILNLHIDFDRHMYSFNVYLVDTVLNVCNYKRVHPRFEFGFCHSKKTPPDQTKSKQYTVCAPL